MGILLRRTECIETNKYDIYFKVPIEVYIDSSYLRIEQIDLSVDLKKYALDLCINRRLNYIVWKYYRSISYKLLRRVFKLNNPYEDIILSIYKKKGKFLLKKIY